MSRSTSLLTHIDQIARLHGRLEMAMEAGNTPGAERLLAELNLVERRRNRVVHAAMLKSAVATPSAPRSLRDTVIATLNALGRSSGVAVVAGVARARFGQEIHPGRLASLRRDELRSWRSSSARPVHIVAPLTHNRFAQIRGSLALSSWPPDLRIVGPLSQRVDLLRIIDNLAAELALDADRIESWANPEAGIAMLRRIAGTVPGAIEGWEVDLARIRRAVSAELSAIEAADAAERAKAVAAARAILSIDQLIWGRRTPAVFGTDIAEGA